MKKKMEEIKRTPGGYNRSPLYIKKLEAMYKAILKEYEVTSKIFPLLKDVYITIGQRYNKSPKYISQIINKRKKIKKNGGK